MLRSAALAGHPIFLPVLAFATTCVGGLAQDRSDLHARVQILGLAPDNPLSQTVKRELQELGAD
jgi:hypothetical protein